MSKSDKEQVDREVRQLDRQTAEAVRDLFGCDTNHWEFCDAVKEGVVSLGMEDGRVAVVPGEFFVDWVWELLANA